MANCAQCNTFVLFGGKRDDQGATYCSQDCLQQALMLRSLDVIPEETIRQAVAELHAGPCPVCGGPGPIEVYVAHKIWSAVYLTSWSSKSKVCCRACGTKHQLTASAFSLALGWWGFPWGLVMTPVQITRNLVGIAKPPDPNNPSPQLQHIGRLVLASHLKARAAQSPVQAGTFDLDD